MAPWLGVAGARLSLDKGGFMTNTPKRALIVIDVQNDYIDGSLRIEYPRVEDSLANIGKAIDAAHATAIPVVLVQNILPAGAPILAEGTRGAELHEVVRSRPHDTVVLKRLPSAFVGTNLGPWLQDRAIDTITVAGYMTQNCDDSTIRHAMHKGLAVELLSDASGAVSFANRAGDATAEEIHRVFTVVLQTRFAAVATTQEWIAAVQHGTPLERDNIFASNQRARGRRQQG
jgi:nicotinamidase-related amidase